MIFWSTPGGPIAADQTVNATTYMSAPSEHVIAARQAVSSVRDVPHRTVSAGTETANVPKTFDVPMSFAVGRYQAWAYRGWRAPLLSTMLAPELQSELDAAGGANTMRPRGMRTVFQVRQAEPWFTDAIQVIG